MFCIHVCNVSSAAGTWSPTMRGRSCCMPTTKTPSCPSSARRSLTRWISFSLPRWINFGLKYDFLPDLFRWTTTSTSFFVWRARQHLRRWTKIIHSWGVHILSLPLCMVFWGISLFRVLLQHELHCEPLHGLDGRHNDCHCWRSLWRDAERAEYPYKVVLFLKINFID